MKYLKNLSNHNDYTAFIASAGFAEIQSEKNAVVSYCRSENHVHYNPYVPETRVVAKYNVTDTSSPTALRANYVQNVFKSMEIDGVMLNELVTEYTFSTTGIHTVKYELYDETKLGIATGGSGPIFYNSNLVECVIPNSVTYIGINVFYNCSGLTNISIPNSVTSICGSAFQACSGLTSIVIPGSVTSIGNNAFQDCSGLTSIVIPNSVTSIGNNAFLNCSSLTSVTIGSGVTSIGDNTFRGCNSLTSVTIPSSVTSIGDNAFIGCSGLTSITIPDSVTSIGNGAFYNCSGLTSIVCNAMTAPTIQSNTFYNMKTGGTLTVPTGSTGYDVWMGTGDYYLGKYNWAKTEL